MNAPVRKPIEAMSEAELVAALADPHWRLRNLYWVADKDGRPVLFQPWPEQQKFYDRIWYRNVIAKARQRGFSTAVQIADLDAALFTPNTACAVIAQDEDTALAIFRTKIRFAWDRLPGLVREMVGQQYLSKHELVLKQGSSMVVAASVRGRTLQRLHVSEYGMICAKYPDRAHEIKTGALPSVDRYGIATIESTVKTPDGHFSDIVREAEKLMIEGRELTPLDYRLHFASWWDADEYELDPALVTVSDVDNAYFYRLEADIGRPVSPAKRAWYVKTRDALSREEMFREYPSTLKEAFSVATEGRWLAHEMATVRHTGRIRRLPVLPGVPVDTFWDLGVTTDSNCCWLRQEVGGWDHWIKFIETLYEPYNAIVRLMQEYQGIHGFAWGRHYLPHDGNQTRPGSESLQTPRDMLDGLGLKNIEIVPRIHDLTVGIDQLRGDFATYVFDEEGCLEGIKHLDGFSKQWNPGQGTWSTLIAKNGHQHGADALRQKAQYAHNLRSAPSKPRNRRNRSGMAA